MIIQQHALSGFWGRVTHSGTVWSDKESYVHTDLLKCILPSPNPSHIMTDNQLVHLSWH